MTPNELEPLAQWISLHCPDVRVVPFGDRVAEPQRKGEEAATGGTSAESGALCARWLQYRQVRDVRLARQGAAPVRVLQRFLLCADQPGDVAAAHVVQTLLLRALDDSGLSIELDGLTPELWSQLGMVGRPGFLLDLPVVERREHVQAPLVQRAAVELKVTAALAGTIRWSHGPPVAGAEVRLHGGSAVAVTGAAGSFRLNAEGLDQRPEFRVRVRSGQPLRTPQAATLQRGLWMLELKHEAVAQPGIHQ